MEVAGSTLQFTAPLPMGWESFGFGAGSETEAASFFVSHVDNTFRDPCLHLEREPKVGPTVEELATAFGEMPNATATDPVDTTLAGHDATHLELAIAATLPCEPNDFYLWQESPQGGAWWVLDVSERIDLWILEVGDERVVVAAHSYPETTEASKARLRDILNSIEFTGGSAPAPSD